LEHGKLEELLDHYQISLEDLSEKEIKELLSLSASTAQQRIKGRAGIIRNKKSQKISGICSKHILRISATDIRSVCNNADRGQLLRFLNRLVSEGKKLQENNTKLYKMIEAFCLMMEEAIEKNYLPSKRLKALSRSLEEGDIKLEDFLRSHGVKNPKAIMERGSREI
jgi:hypothetical protein